MNLIKILPHVRQKSLFQGSTNPPLPMMLMAWGMGRGRVREATYMVSS